MSNFLKAAASYYGLAPGTRMELGMDEIGNPVILARIEVRVADDDMAGIVSRMKAMQADAEALQARNKPGSRMAPPMPSVQRMRDEYNGMDKRTKSQFGSFVNYKAWRLGVAMDEALAGPVDEPVGVSDAVPPYVYLSPAECTPQQKAMAVGQDEKGNYAVAVEDLTETQRIGRVFPDGTLMSARLNGADGKPTSNADDFGGLPG